MFVASLIQHTMASKQEMLHHGGMRKEEVGECVHVASTMQHTRISRLDICFWRDVASWWHAEGRG